MDQVRNQQPPTGRNKQSEDTNEELHFVRRISDLGAESCKFYGCSPACGAGERESQATATTAVSRSTNDVHLWRGYAESASCLIPLALVFAAAEETLCGSIWRRRERWNEASWGRARCRAPRERPCRFRSGGLLVRRCRQIERRGRRPRLGATKMEGCGCGEVG